MRYMPGETVGRRRAACYHVRVESEHNGLEAASEENTAWKRVLLARHPKRPHSLDYIQRLITDFQEIHGDRAFGDDPAIVAGMGRFDDRPVAIVAEQKGRDTKQKLHR